MCYLNEILKTGWGKFLVVGGVLGLIVDIVQFFFPYTTESGQSVRFHMPLALTPGSFTLSWIVVVLISVIPPWAFRVRRKDSLGRELAALWCFGSLFLNMFLMILISQVYHLSPTGYVWFVAAFVTAWRLLTWEETVFRPHLHIRARRV